ncbi:MAG: hypothetical protein WEB58_13390 [Planctomycetaceae bacterium]
MLDKYDVRGELIAVYLILMLVFFEIDGLMETPSGVVAMTGILYLTVRNSYHLFSKSVQANKSAAKPAD